MSLRRVVINGHAFLTLLSIFRIPWSWLRIKFRNERGVRDSAHVWARSLRSLVIHVHSTFAMQFFFLYFFFFCAIRKFRIISFSKHCARRKKTEESRQTVAKRAATNRFSFFGFFLGSKEWEVIVTIISLCSFPY